MAKISYAELANAYGVRTGNFMIDIVTGASAFVCSAYREYTNATVDIIGAGFFVKGIMDTLCKPHGLPQVIPPQFLGGQCQGVMYNVGYEYWDSSQQRFVGFGTAHLGPIGVLRRIINPRGDGVNFYGHSIYNRDYLFIDEQSQEGRVPRIVSVVRQDGQPDNCGDLPSSYPSAPLPDARKRGDVPYTYNDGTKVNVPIKFGDVLSNNRVVIDVGGIDLIFAPDGVSYGDGTDSADMQKLIDLIKKLEEDIKRILDDMPTSPKPPSSGDYDETETSEDSSEAKENVEGLEWIQIELTRSPINAKKQYGRQAQDVIYAGWFQFSVDGFYLPREPIHFKRSVYAAPDGCTGYAYTLYEGFHATVKEFKKKMDLGE